MAVKNYKLFPTKKKLARENNLTPAVSRYYDKDDLFYDFALLDEMVYQEDVKEMLKADLMEHHAVSWFEQPLPAMVQYDKFTRYDADFRTAPHRVYKADGRRVAVIIEITGVRIRKWTTHDIWSEYTKADEIEITCPNFECDYEIGKEVSYV